MYGRTGVIAFLLSVLTYITVKHGEKPPPEKILPNHAHSFDPDASSSAGEEEATLPQPMHADQTEQNEIRVENTLPPLPSSKPKFKLLREETIDVIKSRANKNRDLMLLTVTDTKKDQFLNFLGFAQHKNGLKNWILFCADTKIENFAKSLGIDCHLRLSKRHNRPLFEKHEGMTCPIGDVKPIKSNNPKACQQKVCNPLYTSKCLGYAFNEKHECWPCAGDAKRDMIQMQVQPECQLYYHHPRRSIWYIRWQGMMELFQLGYNVLLIDLDAIIKQDPFPILQQFPESDLIVQRGYSPAPMKLTWGAAVCMGFSYWRATDPKRKYIQDRILDVMKWHGDDQNAANSVLFTEDLNLEHKMTNDTKEIVTGITSSDYTVTFLPTYQFPRTCSSGHTEDQVVAHCFIWPKRASELQAVGNWCLKEDWNKEPVVPLDEYLKKIVE